MTGIRPCHSQFDFVLPIGPPDSDARTALWRGASAQAGAQDIDLDALVAASDGFTPADIGHASQQVAQATFEATLKQGTRVRASTPDYLTAVQQTRPTLTPEDIERFAHEIVRFQRT